MGAPPYSPATGNPPPSQNIQTRPPVTSFLVNDVPPSQFLYVRDGEFLQAILLTNTSFVKVRFTYRYLTPQNEVKEGTNIMGPLTAGVISNQIIPLGEGWLISLEAQVITGAFFGQWTFCQLQMLRSNAAGAVPYGLVWQGYVPNNAGNGWPGQAAKEITDGPGRLVSITGTTPGAGADISETVPAFRRWNLIAFTAVLTSSAAAGNRGVVFTPDDGVNILGRFSAKFAQAASQTIIYTFGPGLQNGDSLNAAVMAPSPQPFLLKSGFRIRTLTGGILAGDQWTAPQYLVQEWGDWDT